MIYSFKVNSFKFVLQTKFQCRHVISSYREGDSRLNMGGSEGKTTTYWCTMNNSYTPKMCPQYFSVLRTP